MAGKVGALTDAAQNAARELASFNEDEVDVGVQGQSLADIAGITRDDFKEAEEGPSAAASSLSPSVVDEGQPSPSPRSTRSNNAPAFASAQSLQGLSQDAVEALSSTSRLAPQFEEGASQVAGRHAASVEDLSQAPTSVENPNSLEEAEATTQQGEQQSKWKPKSVGSSPASTGGQTQSASSSRRRQTRTSVEDFERALSSAKTPQEQAKIIAAWDKEQREIAKEEARWAALGTRGQVEEVWEESSKDRIEEARSYNKALDEYGMPEDELDYDLEAFMNVLQSEIDKKYTSFSKTRRVEGVEVHVPDQGAGISVQEDLRNDRYISRIIRLFKLGFFHLATEHVEVDANGEKHLRWSSPVGAPIEQMMERVCEEFGLDFNTLDAKRTVFRCVILYASMSADMFGKYFDNKHEGVLFEENFLNVCRLMLQSCERFGHPFAPPWMISGAVADKLANTNIYPSGYIPMVVAKAITGPNSRIGYNARELQAVAEDLWENETHPKMLRDLAYKPDRRTKKQKEENPEEDPGKKLAQRICIEKMQYAFSRIDGTDPKDFSERFGVDTDPHYTLEEYLRIDAKYANISGVSELMASLSEQERLDIITECKEKLDSMSDKEFSTVAAVTSALVGIEKTNALFWQIPIMLSAIAEKGVGCLQTNYAIKSISKTLKKENGVESMQMSEEITKAFMTPEASEAIDAALILLDLGGPEALVLFAETRQPMTHSAVVAWAHKNILPKPGSKAAAAVQEKLQKVEEWQRHMLAGDRFFKKTDAMNFLNAFLASNQARLAVLQSSGAGMARAGVALTGTEIDDVFLSHYGDPAFFLSDIMRLDAGRDALIMMRQNNIANFNPVGYKINKVLRNNGVPNLLVTTFLDTFATYSMNYLYAILPGSRALTYCLAKYREAKGDKTAHLYTIGGGLADVDGASIQQMFQDEAFLVGLRMNLAYDGAALQRWIFTAAILAGVIAFLGLEPPDNEEDLLNISMWKVGGKEINVSFWLNDLTQLGLPLAYGTAALLCGYDAGLATALTLDSLYDQINGNVVVDAIRMMKGLPDELSELEKMRADSSYKGKFNVSTSIIEQLLTAGDKLIPGAPLWKAISRSSWWQGGDFADAHDPNKKYDKSSDWAIDVAKVDYIDNDVERIFRKHSYGNFLYAFAANLFTGFYFGDDKDEKTGYFWWEMPIKKVSSDEALYWAEVQKMDYTNRDGCSTDQAYNEVRTDELLEEIDEVVEAYGGIDQAIMNGYIITHDIRRAAQVVLSERLAKLELEFEAREKGGTLPKYSSAWYDAKDAKQREKNRIWYYLNILSRDDLPSWIDGYSQVITDYDVTYTHEDGSPALSWEWLLDTQGKVKAEWKLKGNHPTSFVPTPWTFVDQANSSRIPRGWNAETRPGWAIEGENGGVNVEAIRNYMGDKVIPSGRHEGKTFNEVYFGMNSEGELEHPEQITAGSRALAPLYKKG